MIITANRRSKTITEDDESESEARPHVQALVAITEHGHVHGWILLHIFRHCEIYNLINYLINMFYY